MASDMGQVLADLGWDSHFAEQVQPDQIASCGRVAEVHRDRIIATTGTADLALVMEGGGSTAQVAVGDWVRFDAEQSVVVEVLVRKGALRRRAAGTTGTEQLIAANVDTLFIVTSCNADFNLARLERYLTLASAGDSMPVIVLTKADLNPEAETLRRQAERLSPLCTAVTVNALEAEAVAVLSPWLRPGETGVLVGSSGVGKSTLLNALTGAQSATQGIREDDAKGRHTTTVRSLRRAKTGGWVIDTPGVRQIAPVDAAEAIDAVFSDVSSLAGQCRFSDCAHLSEPGCAVQAAIETGALEEDRLRRWRKLHLEDQYNAEATAATRSRQKAFSKKVKTATGRKRGRKGA